MNLVKTVDKNQNHYTRLTTPKHVTSWQCYLHVIAPRQHSYLHRCWSSGKPFATLCKIWLPTNSRPPAHALFIRHQAHQNIGGNLYISRYSKGQILADNTDILVGL